MSFNRKFSTFRELFFFVSRPYLWLRAPLRKGGLNPDPVEQFRRWYEAAGRSLWMEFPNACCLSTLDVNDYPDSRMVLLKSFSNEGFVFYTNTDSAKGAALKSSPKAALCFYWGALQRQVRIKGDVYELSAEEADAYFASRPRGSQIGAWASKQSEKLESREVLEKRQKEMELKYKGKTISRPLYWSGYRIKPVQFEFWQLRLSRLHDRFQYNLDKDAKWTIDRLSP